MNNAGSSDPFPRDGSGSRVSLFDDVVIDGIGIAFEQNAAGEGYRFIAGVDEVAQRGDDGKTRADCRFIAEAAACSARIADRGVARPIAAASLLVRRDDVDAAFEPSGIAIRRRAAGRR